ncbi:MAG: hypothetical protein K0M55_19905, partial [Rhizobium sp.]|nr:hypothetical protein [Rhizobium sp.]
RRTGVAGLALKGNIALPQDRDIVVYKLTGCSMAFSYIKYHTLCPLPTELCGIAAPPCHYLGNGHTASCHLINDNVSILR